MIEKKNAAKTLPKVIDLFSGAGGLSLGAARAGFDVCCAVENEKHAMATHLINFPNSIHVEIDIAKITGFELLALCNIEDNELAGIIGGPPCQGFSSIGKKHKNDPRNNLFVDFFRIVSEAMPKFFLAENVPGILNENYAETRKRAIAFVEDEFTCLSPIKICAREYGAPTTRTRVFFFGYRKDQMNSLTESDFAPPMDIEKVTVAKALKGLPIKIKQTWLTEEQSWRISKPFDDGYFGFRLREHIPQGIGDITAINRLQKERRVSGCLGTVHSKKVAERYGKTTPGTIDKISKSYRLKSTGFCPTLRAGTGPDQGSFQAVRPIHPKENRVITPREAARLQGFPDWFQFQSTKWHSFRQIGSSVSPILAERILSVIYKSLNL